MPRRIRWTKSASLSLESLEAYTARDNPKAAVGIVLMVVRAVEQLVTHPNPPRWLVDRAILPKETLICRYRDNTRP
ncbi:type II toxin-antitoxin system RelE/ParE family toxin [Desulfoferrobacter suflitae]|uniref:type II toxin-antitoxin system RelE/ParE family toxin n=1 Tax=Desulfoferrobacter suflitae TaxID=2865782 RepID=UPI00338DAEF2